ncbi:MAG: FAD-binding oxidoreductase [Cyanobacteria bacterium]|nr:FAD-binding oxidoreductase [Cyanobacteriota bacterium]MDA0866143.1 FAD-binding oxidoreductase [Cyanobacteriota bacterium]
MQTFDWIVVGNGLTGAALSYELSRQGLSVLLLDRSDSPASATRFSYGGIPYWSGTTDVTRQLCREGRTRHLALPAETGVDTEFRELDLLLTVPAGEDPATMAQTYSTTESPPQPISVDEAIALEPQLNPQAMAGALTVRHGHVNPMALVKAYNQGFQALGGHRIIAPVTGLVRIGEKVTGVTTLTQAYAAGQVAIAAGGFTRTLVQTIGLTVPVYFTHAEILETPPQSPHLRTLIMPAALTRSGLEAQTSETTIDDQWEQSDQALAPPVLDLGCIQFRNGIIRIGQISRIHTALQPPLDEATSTAQLRQGISHLVPALGAVPGQWRTCPVAFSRDGLPLAGSVPGLRGLSLFSGFSSPFALVPGLATHFAEWAVGQSDQAGPSDLMAAVSPGRFERP